MQDTLDQIPPEAWPLLEFLLLVSAILAGVWLIITLFILWRRSASNLTPVNAARKNKKAQPDFLKVDEKARREAMERGESFEKELERRERIEARQEDGGMSLVQRIIGLASFLMSVFTLLTMILGAIFQVTRMGSMLETYSSADRILTVIQNNPIAFGIVAFVTVFYIYQFVTKKPWKEA